MNNKRNFGAVGATVVAAFSLSGLLMLSACEERPYPKPVKTYAEAPKAPPAQLYGAPAAPPPAYAPPAYTPPPVAYAPPPQPVYAPQPQRTYAYDAPAIVAMAPIPNPGDEYGAAPYRHGRRVHAPYAAASEPTYNDGYAPKPPRPVYHKPAHPAYTPKPTPPVYAAKPVAPKPYTPPKPVTPPTYAAKPVPPKPVTPPVYTPPKPNTYAQKGAAVGAAAGAATGVVAKNAKPDAKAIAATAKAAYNANKPGATPAAPAPATGADRSTRLAALQSALTDAVSKGAALKAPDRFTANQPADVTLTVPAGFADTLRTEAQKNGLSDAAASVNLTAVLSGDGFSVTPDETQSQPLTVGQETTFRWTVTAQPGAKGPLHADVGADLLGGGSDTLALGSVQKAAGLGVKLTPRVVGAAILVLILALVVVWLARGRGGPSRPASARRASRNARGGARPLDMGEGSAH
jgi:hypothetical protein